MMASVTYSSVATLVLRTADTPPATPREVREPAAPSAQQRSGLTHSGNNDPAAAADRSHSPVDVGWQVKDTQRLVNLYSENVVQEPSSTEVVDRESIANLTSTRGKWEAIFTSTEPRDEPAAKPTSKWQVRMPYAEKPCAGPDTVSSNNLPSEEPDSPPPEEEQQPGAGVDMESAIEREIRLAVEREDMLRREQEERLRQLSQQASGGVKGSSSMESSTESELQPSYHELAEADRGSQFFLNHNASVHHRHQQQEEDAEREESLQRGYSVHQKLSKSQVGATESIIEREIRLQREREAELARQRGGRVAPSAVAPDSSPRGESEDGGEVEVVLVEEIPYENAISRYNHDGESRIAQELRELREREDEVRQLRERMLRTSVSGAPDASSQQKTSAVPPSSLSPANSKATAKPPSTPQGGNRSTPTTPHVDKSPSISFSRSFHSSPLVEPPATPPPSKTTPTPKPETPIEREIRLARDRENELRRSKGLPDLKPEPQKQDSFEERGREREEEVVTPRHPFYNPSQPDSTMRRFASNRLQQEMLVQHNREMKLRQEGKIISMSEEHIQPQKYTEVVAHDQTDGVVKRNFRTPARRNSNASQDSNASGDVTLRSGQVSAPSPHATPREGGGSGKKTTAGTGAVSFSYREFAQTAESKIERELREMSEREEELRKLRSGVAES